VDDWRPSAFRLLSELCDLLSRVTELISQRTTMSKTVKDLTAGTAGGIAQVFSIFFHSSSRSQVAQVLVGQPFDIVKVVGTIPPQVGPRMKYYRYKSVCKPLRKAPTRA
jgi:hypothetical protein